MSNGQRLLILNRRDHLNPLGGGAEVYLREMAEGFVERGWGVDWFCSRFAGAGAVQQDRGIRLIRRGGETTVHAHGRLFLAAHHRDYAAVLDSFNGIGFLTAGRRGSVLMLFQLYDREFWGAELGAAGPFFSWLEKRLLRAYRGHRCITISPSTQRDLEALGLKDITVVPVGLSAPVAPAPSPLRDPLQLVYVGRLRPTKNPADAIEAFKRIRREVPDARLTVIGQGPQEAELKAAHAGLPGLEFAGFLDDAEKFARIRQSHACLVPSLREGWNMVVTECAAAGTACVGYRVPGVADSIRNGETGDLVPVRDVEALAAAALALYRDRDRLERYRRDGIAWASRFRWEESRRLFFETVTRA